MSNRNSRPQQAEIASGNTASGAISLQDVAFGSLQLPAEMDGVEITIQGRLAEGTWGPIYQSDGTSVVPSLAFNANRVIRLPDEIFAVPEIRFVSDATETAKRVIQLFSKS